MTKAGEVVHRCGFCGETFQIKADDPHWSTGRGPLCPNRTPIEAATGSATDVATLAAVLTAADLSPTDSDHVINCFARCRVHNTIRAHGDEPCWKCWKERNESGAS
jgi:hypothetical protein